jgi:hypothetical protein
VHDRAVAGLIAGAVSGAPSTLWALATGRDPLEATRAAGAILLPGEERPPRLLAAAAVVHLAVSLFWASVLPRRLGVRGGALAGLAIAAFDLGVIGRRFPAIRALPLAPQLADHAAYGAVVGWALRPDAAPGRSAVRWHRG